jgi:hypothetical protein
MGRPLLRGGYSPVTTDCGVTADLPFVNWALSPKQLRVGSAG